MTEINKNFRVKHGLEVGGDGTFEGTVTADSFQLDTTYITGSAAPGEIAWNPDAGTIEFALKDGNIVHRVGQQEIIRVENTTGSTIAKGSVVYISGASGFLPRISLADASAEATSSKTFGLVASDGGIATGAEGFVLTSGLLRGVNTNGISAGTGLWLSTTAGEYTSTRPTAPDNGVFIGWVVKSATNGEILVKIQNGYELEELHNVLIDGTPADNEVLAYDSTGGVWKNQTAAEAGLAASSHTHALDDLSDVTITTPSSGQVLKYNGSTWVNDTDATGGGGNSFTTIAVSGQSNVVADSSSDTLTLVSGSNITITTDSASDTITIAATDTNTTYTAGTGLNLNGTQFQNAGVLSVNGDAGAITNVAKTNTTNTFNGGAQSIVANLSTTVPLTVTGATSQSANLLEIKDSSNANVALLAANGNFQTSVTGSSTASPRLFGLGTGAFAVGEAARFQFADQFNSIQTSYAGRTRISSFWGLELTGRSNVAPSFVAGAANDPGVSILGTIAGSTGLLVKGAASQSASLQEWQNSSGTVLASISSAGLLTAVPATPTAATSAEQVGYMGMPEHSTTKTGAYTIVLADAGKHIYSTASRTVTIPANSSVAFEIGTAITFISGSGTTTTIAITTDTLILAGIGTTGTRQLAAHGMATAVKVAATTWYISGNGLT